MNMKMKLRMRMRMRMKMYMILSFNKCGKVFILHFACDCDPEQSCFYLTSKVLSLLEDNTSIHRLIQFASLLTQ